MRIFHKRTGRCRNERECTFEDVVGYVVQANIIALVYFKTLL